MLAIKQSSQLATRSFTAAKRAPIQLCCFRALHFQCKQRRPRATMATMNHPQRHFATPPPQVKHSDLPMHLYHQYADATMDTMLESLENLLDEIGDPEHEVEYSSGVLTLKLGSKGTYVINKQPPNKQIWLSSPFSGPKRYDYVEDQDGWVYLRDGRSLSDLLNQELSDALGRDVDLGLTAVSSRQS
ncbi:Frataxin [Cubamyces sp. BRFM 1775]|nr:Frataxin [Cubamyces sp. BRFM 1775]